MLPTLRRCLQHTKKRVQGSRNKMKRLMLFILSCCALNAQTGHTASTLIQVNLAGSKALNAIVSKGNYQDKFPTTYNPMTNTVSCPNASMIFNDVTKTPSDKTPTPAGSYIFIGTIEQVIDTKKQTLKLWEPSAQLTATQNKTTNKTNVTTEAKIIFTQIIGQDLFKN